ncbi:ATP-dependent DNA helicase RecG [Chelatococcus reniformis]|uniref:ATP-dependent DNA helicase RecG n=1 Tax=Chelatococcus reniformis TaxID=1494448 RepID=A0A916U129_9HYPH|nr:ATP-dependent DNA helicase RecG [Chelatococcus reniformis]GGC55536.1 ATP-dependent DNA helicase RecG [Chelatococcus reniformis]
MRPSVLDPLFATVAVIPGIGPRLAQLFDRLLGSSTQPARLIDLLFHLPTGVIDRRSRPLVADAVPGEVVTLDVRVARHQPAPPQRARSPYRILVEDDTGDVTLIYFGGGRQRLEKLLPVGERRIVSGRLELRDGHRQIVHPDLVLRPDELAGASLVEPVYPLTEGLSGRIVAKATAEALRRVPQLPEWQDMERQGALPPFAAALRSLHQPPDAEAADPTSPGRARLALDEILATQLALGLVRSRRRRTRGRVHQGDGTRVAAIRAALPFKLTAAQSTALAEIDADLAAPDRMLRLLQGDVGSGKTVCALLAMARVVEAGRQAALMAPTEILARQHHARIAPLARAGGLEVAVLTGRDKAAERAAVLDGLASGRVHAVVGTHALFQESVAFRDLGLAVVDEQHRFGVHQRLALGAKGDSVDLLVMTATPIPRTLVLTLFGDMDVSLLTEKPAGRQPIQTRAVPLERLDEVVGAVARAAAGGARVYWICPLVAESEELDVAAAQERYGSLNQALGAGVGLLHGKMNARDKDAAMASFAAGDTQVLVATTVVEVGVDVPEATVMVVEHAERFGLAQLHQLRGRVGRGGEASSCLLLYRAPLGPVAEARLRIMRETEDGFRIAEEDLKLRGQGEILGTRQSGVPDFRFLRPDIDADLIAAARDEARLVLERDPELTSARGEALRLLLYLFGRDEAIRLLRAG